MSMTILDGSGKGYLARVNHQQRLQTIGVSETMAAHHALDGDAYNINTGNIALSTAGKSAVLYLKNNEDREIIIESFIYMLGTNTGGSGDHLVQVERNPTAGTIVSNAVANTPINRDFASSNTLTVDSYSGVEGDTLTGGTVVVQSLLSSVGRTVVSVGAIVLRKGNTVGITITPATSTSAMTVQMAMSVYIVNESTQDIL